MRKYAIVLMCLGLLATPLLGCQSDTTSPEVISSFPAYGQFDVERGVDITISFTEPMNKNSVENNFSITPAVAGTFTWSSNTVKFTPTEILLSATGYTVSFTQPVTDVAGNELAEFSILFTTHTPITNTYNILSYDWMPDSKGLVMAADIEDAYQIYMLSTDGKTQYRINPSSGQQMDPHAASDGKVIAYVGDIPSELFIYDLVQQKTVQFSLDPQGDLPTRPIISPDGTKIAFLSVLGFADAHSDLYQSVWVVDRNEPNSVAMQSPPGDTDWLLGFSSDSSKLYVLGTYEMYNQGRNFRYDVWEIDVNSRQQTRLSETGPIHNFSSGDLHPHIPQFVYGAWEPVEVQENIIESATDIYVVEIASFTQTKLTSSGRNAYPVFSPDGTRIAFAKALLGTGRQWEIYTMSSDGSNVIQLTSTDAPKLYPQWSPDGSMISFIQIEGEACVLYVMNADGSQLRRLTH
ncbi:MAG: TolB protein [Bacillota bacterium]|nr:MAG: TolB protein [Bacillota bacterium]MBS3949684.1 Ig-like domain-containing protein [Peptococcaceae bacterium]